jgi:protein TIF31
MVDETAATTPVEESKAADAAAVAATEKALALPTTEDPQVVPSRAIPPPLKDLVVLPPRQKEGAATVAETACLGLPPLRPEEPVQSIRLALSEVVGYAHLTNYRLEVEAGHVRATSSSSTGDSTPDPTVPPPLISPYTGPEAVVSVSVHLRSLNQPPSVVVGEPDEALPVLDDYADLQATVGMGDGAALRIVLEAYDEAAVRDHVVRLRQLLGGNPPSVTSLVADSASLAASRRSRPDATPMIARNPRQLSVPRDQEMRVATENLQDFFYLSCGEDPAVYRSSSSSPAAAAAPPSKSKKKKKAKTADSVTVVDGETTLATVAAVTEEEWTKQQAVRINELEERMKVPCTITYSGFHPPPSFRKLVGDVAYLEARLPSTNGGIATTVFLTATTTGFYVNQCKSTGESQAPIFDPTPASEACFSHALLDCLLQASPLVQTAWETSIAAVQERAEILGQGNRSTFTSLFRMAVRGDSEGATNPAQTMDAHLATPSWLVPRSLKPVSPFASHAYNTIRAEEDLAHSFGIDIRSGSLRDWNDEIQMAREMPTEKLYERLERARLLHKIMTEFGEAALQGVQAVTQGQVMSMNPNEGTRTQVFLHNNIFISRALDVGPDTFRLTKGDAAAKKSVSREIQCIKTLQRMENPELSTLGTVMIDYRGGRFMCQSVLPGILAGEKCHKVLLGSVDFDAPLNWDEEVHQLLSEKIGEPLNLRAGPMHRSPLTDARKEECRLMKKISAAEPEKDGEVTESEKTAENGDSTKSADDAEFLTCVPIEAKVIRGSDHRKYILDFSRMTPRDANWVSESKGGTGRWETVQKDNGTTRFVPTSLDDDEWLIHILRPELINRWIRSEFSKTLEEKRTAVEEQKATAGEGEDDKKESKDEVVHLTEEEQKKITEKLRLNVNVFFPDIRSVGEEQMEEDEGRARDAAAFLWDDILPRITKGIRERSGPQIPADGKSLTEFLHRNGVNCRYMGRLAVLAQEEEKKDLKVADDLKHGRMTLVERMTMPRCWLEMLECEMVGRASKHVLDSYLIEHSGVASWTPAQTVAAFLSALVSEVEETAAQTESRLEKESGSRPDDDDMQSLRIADVGGDGDAIPIASRSRTEIWQDIELEVARRFRYTLTLFNRGCIKSDRSLYIPVLRRVCQRCGIRLAADSYSVGSICYTSGNSFGGRLTSTYPISPLDVVDVVPLMKHSAAYHEGFAMCSFGPGNLCTPPLQISLIDARVALERAHVKFSSRELNAALELAQEAASLYQRVTENGAHPGIVDCLELMATIFLEAGDPMLASENCLKSLGLAIQAGGFDSAAVFGLHMSLFQMLFAAKELDRCVKHLRAAIYILGLMGGPNHYELNGAYLKLLSTYKHDEVKGQYNQVALNVYRVLNELDPADRLMEGLSERRFAQTLADVGEFKEAMDAEKRAYSSLLRFVGPDHELVKNCDKSLKEYTLRAVEQGKGMVQTEKLKHEAEIADAVAADLVAAEDGEKKKKKANKKKKGKK